jgi:predicted ATPase
MSSEETSAFPADGREVIPLHAERPRLDFAKMRFRGRTRELDRLKNIYKESCLAEYPSASSVIVEATSGVGKTALVDAFVEHVEEGRNALVGRGKFEEATAASEPFSALISAMNSLLQQLARTDERGLWAQLIREALTSDASFLSEIIPELDHLLNENTRRKSEGSLNSSSSFTFDGFGNMADKEWRFERFRLGIRSLMRCISSRKPVVVVFDDMHWAEQDSITVIWTVMEDTRRNRRLLILGASRPIRTNKYLSLMRKELKDDLISVFKLKDLTLADISRVLSSLLDCGQEETASLAQVAHLKTHGNIFVILQLLRISEQAGHIYYLADESRWAWNETAIISQLEISGNVIDVVADKLMLVDPVRKSALITAASFGTSYFEVDTIVHAMKLLDEDSEKLREGLNDDAADYEQVDPYVVRQNIRVLNQALLNAAKDGLVDELGPGRYRFAHDRIREAAYSLLPSGFCRAKLHLKIGRQLRSWMETQSELIGNTGLSDESLLLNATNQLNLGAVLITDHWESLDLAELNFQAAEHSARKSSFVPAMDFLQRGIAQLGNDSWDKHYTLTLKLTAALTRIQFCCGLYDTCVVTADQVISNAKSFAQKRPVYHTKIMALLQNERQNEASEVVLTILDTLGAKLPRKFVLVKVYSQLTSLDAKFRLMSNEDLLNLPDADDPDGSLDDVAGFLERLAELSYFGGHEGYILHYVTRVNQLTLERGQHRRSAFAFSVYAWIKAASGNIPEALRIADVARKLASDRKFGIHDLRAEMICTAFFDMFNMSWPEIVDPLAAVFDEMRGTGAMELVHFDGFLYHRLAFVSGMPLSQLVQKCAEYNEIVLDYRQPIFWSLNAPLTQAVLNLMGHSKNPTQLIGEHMDEDILLPTWKLKGNIKAIGQYHLCRMMLAVFLRDYELALEMDEKLPPLMDEGLGACVPCRLFYGAIAIINMSKDKRFKRKMRRRQVSKIIQTLNEWVEVGLGSCKHMVLILHAELSAATGKDERPEIENAYQKAIRSARDAGALHHEALANELAGCWLAGQKGKEKHYMTYLMKATTLYEAWGAAVKVDDIFRRFPDCFGEQPAMQYKSSSTMPVTGSFSSSMWSASLYQRNDDEIPSQIEAVDASTESLI